MRTKHEAYLTPCKRERWRILQRSSGVWFCANALGESLSTGSARRHYLQLFEWRVLFILHFRTVAAVVGALYLLRKILGTLCFLVPFIKAYYLAPWGIFRTDLRKYGPWAGKYEGTL